MDVSAAFHNRKSLYRNDFESASTFFGKFYPSKTPRPAGFSGKIDNFRDSLDLIGTDEHNMTILGTPRDKI
jgi:hypothetical protein